MKLGLIGLPNVGKSTLFNALTNSNVPSENYPFCTIDPNIGTVAVPDERLLILQKIYSVQKTTSAIVDFVDIAGLVRGASKGEGLGNKFLSHVREVDALVHIVRCFEDPDVAHISEKIDPINDIETINTELILSDIESLEKRIDKTNKSLRASNDKKMKVELDLMQSLLEHLSSGKPARTFSDDKEKTRSIKEMFLLSSKPVVYVANIAEDELSKDLSNNLNIKNIKDIVKDEKSEIIIISAIAEEEISKLDENEKEEYLSALGFKESGLERLIHSSYKLLGLFSFLTVENLQIRAWTILKGTKAPQAAGKIHTDFEKGFIKAEIVNFNDIVECGSINTARENGKVRIEGKDYIMQENDIVRFRFNT